MRITATTTRNRYPLRHPATAERKTAKAYNTAEATARAYAHRHPAATADTFRNSRAFRAFRWRVELDALLHSTEAWAAMEEAAKAAEAVKREAVRKAYNATPEAQEAAQAAAEAEAVKRAEWLARENARTDAVAEQLDEARLAAKAKQTRRQADKAHRAEVAAALAEGDIATAEALRAEYGLTAWAELEQGAAGYLAHLAKVREDYKAAQAAAEAAKATGDAEVIKAATAARKAAWRAMYEAENNPPIEYFTTQTAAAIRKAVDPTAKAAARRVGKAGEARPQGEHTADTQTAAGEAVEVITGGKVSNAGMGKVERTLTPGMYAALSALAESRRLFNEAEYIRMPSGSGRDQFARSVKVSDALRAEADRLTRRAEAAEKHEATAAEAVKLYHAAAEKRAAAARAAADLSRAYDLIGDILPDGLDLFQTSMLAALDEAAQAASREAVSVAALPGDWMQTEYTRRRLARKVYEPGKTARQYSDEVVTPGRMIAREVAATIEAARSARVDTAAGYVCVSLCDLMDDDGDDIAYIKYPAYLAATAAAADSVFSAVDGEQTARYGDLCETFAAAAGLTPTEAAIVSRRFRGQDWGYICKAMGYKTARTLERHRAAIEEKAIRAGYGSAAIREAIADRDGKAAEVKAAQAAAALALAEKAEADRAAAHKAAQAAAALSAGSAAVCVVCMDEAGRVLADYASIGEAAKATGASKGAISQAIKGARKTAAGYRWAKA